MRYRLQTKDLFLSRFTGEGESSVAFKALYACIEILITVVSVRSSYNYSYCATSLGVFSAGSLNWVANKNK